MLKNTINEVPIAEPGGTANIVNGIKVKKRLVDNL